MTATNWFGTSQQQRRPRLGRAWSRKIHRFYRDHGMLWKTIAPITEDTVTVPIGDGIGPPRHVTFAHHEPV